LKDNYIRLHIAQTDAIKFIVDNPFKGGEVKVGTVPKSREGVKTDEFGDQYMYVQVRDNVDPYREYMYHEKVARKIDVETQNQLEREQPEKEKQAIEQNIPHRYRNSNTYKKHFLDSGRVGHEDGKAQTTPAPSTSRKTISNSGSRPQFKTSPAKGRTAKKH